MTESFANRWQTDLDLIETAGRRRHLRPVRRLPGGRIDMGHRLLIDFAANDSLGLSFHPDVIAGSRQFTADWGAGAGASRLVGGNLLPYGPIERKIAAGKHSPAALLLASGFQANVSLLPALFAASASASVATTSASGALVFADRLNHASLIQGCRLAGLKQWRFHHNDLDHLRRLLQTHQTDRRTKFIVTESVFSMDGDRADVESLTSLALEFDAFLYLDEAHATGLYGESGFGLSDPMAPLLERSQGLVMGTLSKSLGSFGGYAACSTLLRDYLLHRCGGLVFATALPPAVLGAIDAALDLLPSLNAERHHVARLSDRFRQALTERGLDSGSSSTHIVPILLGTEERALSLAAHLETEGCFAVAIRPPTVPTGGSRVRFSFSAVHSDEDLDRLIAAIDGWQPPP